jgi:hypothetical protein
MSDDLSTFICEFKYQTKNGKQLIYDVFRSKYVTLTPEELVRQKLLTYLITEKSYPKSRIAVEKAVEILNKTYRCDALIYDKSLNIIALIECKAPSVQISQSTFDQIGIYNLAHLSPNLLITNGKKHLWIKYGNSTPNDYKIEVRIPQYDEL